jgi:hypothetical protein
VKLLSDEPQGLRSCEALEYNRGFGGMRLRSDGRELPESFNIVAVDWCAGLPRVEGLEETAEFS